MTMGEEGKLYDRSWNPGGGIIATAHDLVIWNEMLHQGHLLSIHNYKQMITPSSKREHPRYGKIGYGFGVQLLEKDGYHEISHSGYIDGYASTLIYYPQSKISVVILENVSWDITDVIRVYKVHDDIRNIIWGAGLAQCFFDSSNKQSER